MLPSVTVALLFLFLLHFLLTQIPYDYTVRLWPVWTPRSGILNIIVPRPPPHPDDLLLRASFTPGIFPFSPTLIPLAPLFLPILQQHLKPLVPTSSKPYLPSLIL